MNPILYNYYIDTTSQSRTLNTTLCLLHELRIVSRQQLLDLLNIDDVVTLRGMTRMIQSLTEKNLIEKYKIGKEVFYYLSKRGYQSMGGYYSLPKVPEYNLAHHVEVNNHLIQVIQLVKDHPHLKYIQTERRKVYEIKDFKRNASGLSYRVPDFICRFLTKKSEEVDWSFEIELTLKSRNRYLKGILPKYNTQLKNYEEEQIFYSTPSQTIEKEIKLIAKEVITEENKDRFHVYGTSEFEKSVQNHLLNDPFINW